MFSLTFSSGFPQLINELTHIQTYNSSCIDLIFTDQVNVSINYGVHESLHPNCHHHFVQSNFNLNVSYPLPYERLKWDFKKTDSTNIRTSLDKFGKAH